MLCHNAKRTRAAVYINGVYSNPVGEEQKLKNLVLNTVGLTVHIKNY